MRIQRDNFIRARTLLSVAIRALDDCQTEMIMAYGHLSDDSRAVQDAHDKAADLVEMIDRRILSTGGGAL